MAANRRPDVEPSSNITIRTDETHGVKIATAKKLTSKATSLGATEASAGVVKMALAHPGEVRCATIPDEMAMHIARLFAGMLSVPFALRHKILTRRHRRPQDSSRASLRNGASPCILSRDAQGVGSPGT